MLKQTSLLLLGVSIYKAIKFISHSLNGNQPTAVGVDDSSNDDVSLSQMVSPPPTKYDVFLSFRGDDTCNNFASHLYNELCKAGIHTFMDHELCKGEQISPILFRTIEESEISMIIFSENYAYSTWCMDELVHILECKKKFGRVVMPIFYNVDPSNIRKQNGSFGKGFDGLKRRFEHNKEKLQNWRNALIQSTSFVGWDSDSIRRQLFYSPKTLVRLWRHEDIYEFFIRDKGIEAIRCLSLDLSKIRRTTWRASNFRKMHNLIFLKVHKSDKSKPSELTICDDLDYLPEELRFFRWEEYPFPHMPSHFCCENLITLHICNSNI